MCILYLIAAPEYAQRFAKGLGVIACVAAEISCLARPQAATLVKSRNMTKLTLINPERLFLGVWVCLWYLIVSTKHGERF